MLLSWEIAKRHWLPLPNCWNPPTIRNGLTVSEEVEEEKVIRPELHPAGKALSMGEVVRAVSEATHNGAILVTDVGQNQMMSARYFKYSKERSIVTSGGLGTMGFGRTARYAYSWETAACR